MMCEYCKGNKSLYRYSKTSRSAFIKKKMRGWYLLTGMEYDIQKEGKLVRKFDIRSQFIIKYCPMCGEKLEN